MPLLNETVDFQILCRSVRGLSTAFRGSAEKVRLNAGAELTRFTSTHKLLRDGPLEKYALGVFGGSWWIETDYFWRYISELRARKADVIQALRARFAIATDFNSDMDGWTHIYLTNSVYCWRGLANWQSEQQSNLSYIGGGQQIYLPNLASAGQNGMSSMDARIRNWTSIATLQESFSAHA